MGKTHKDSNEIATLSRSKSGLPKSMKRESARKERHLSKRIDLDEELDLLDEEEYKSRFGR